MKFTSIKNLILTFSSSALILIGIYFRVSKFSDLGFEYDTVFTQHTWAKAAVEMGFVKFWREYNGHPFLDYIPGAVYFGMILKYISNIFSDSPTAFVAVLKIFNSITDVIFGGFVFWISKYKVKNSTLKSLFIAALLFGLPASWFVSTYWGQFDSIMILLVFISLMLLFMEQDRFYLLSGILFAIALNLKLQPFIFIPIYTLFFLLKGKWSYVRNFLLGFGLINLVFILPAAIINPERTLDVFGQPFTRTDYISNGARSFWILFGRWIEYGYDTIFTVSGFSLKVSTAALAIFALLCIVSTYFILRIDFKYLWKFKIKKFYRSIREKNYNLGFPALLLLTIMLNFSYFMFMMKMHSRYAHFAVLYSIILLMFLKGRKFIFFLIPVVVFNLANTMNQILVYYYHYFDKFNPRFVEIFWENPNRSYIVASMQLICFILFLIFTLKEGRKLSFKQPSIERSHPS